MQIEINIEHSSVTIHIYLRKLRITYSDCSSSYRGCFYTSIQILKCKKSSITTASLKIDHFYSIYGKGIGGIRTTIGVPDVEIEKCFSGFVALVVGVRINISHSECIKCDRLRIHFYGRPAAAQARYISHSHILHFESGGYHCG